MKHSDTRSEKDAQDFDFNSLLHPAQAFGHPSEVVGDADLTLQEKRCDPSLMGVGRLRR